MPKLNADWVGAYFDHGVDVENRRAFLSEITEESAAKIVRGLYLMETLDAETAIELFICSPGGEVEQALGLYDIMKTLKVPVHTFAYGRCMSAAPLLLAAGEPGNRWVSANTMFMIHPASDELEGKVGDLKSQLKYLEQLDKVWIDLFTKHTNKDRTFWARHVAKGTDWYFTAGNAIEYGLADEIWEER